MTAREEEIVKGSQFEAPIDITSLANRLGIPVYETTDLPTGVSGKIERDLGGRNLSGYNIYINAADSYSRQRFTIAHEIAHYLLHREKIGDALSDDGLYRSVNVSTREESAANNKAADLLMPADLVRQHLDSGLTSYVDLASLFAVSVPAMKARLKFLSYW